MTCLQRTWTYMLNHLWISNSKVNFITMCVPEVLPTWWAWTIPLNMLFNVLTRLFISGKLIGTRRIDAKHSSSTLLIVCWCVCEYFLVFIIIIYLKLLLLQGISSSRKLLAESSEEAAIPSPLTPVLAISSGKGEDQNQKAVSKPSTVQAVLKGIKQVWDATFFFPLVSLFWEYVWDICISNSFCFSLVWLLELLKWLCCFWDSSWWVYIHLFLLSFPINTYEDRNKWLWFYFVLVDTVIWM